MMYNQSQFGCKRVTSSEDVTESYILITMSPMILTLTFSDSNPIFVHDIPAYDDVSLWLQKVQQLDLIQTNIN